MPANLPHYSRADKAAADAEPMLCVRLDMPPEKKVEEARDDGDEREVNRRAWLYTPSAKATGRGLPLVVALHGGGGRADKMNKLTRFNALAEREGFMVAYPEGVQKQWNDGRTNLKWRKHDDVAFVARLIEHLCVQYPIDRRRVYAAGISNGGFFSQYMAMKRPGLLAAIASVAASLPCEIARQTMTPQPVPIVLILGTDDPLVPFQGGEIVIGNSKRGAVISARDCLQYWLSVNRCQTTARREQIVETKSDEQMQITMEAFTPAPGSESDGAPVVLYTVGGGGHTWPSGWQYLPERLIGRTSRSLDATEAIWNFFKDKSVPSIVQA